MTTFNIAKIVDSMPSPGLDFEYCAVKQTEMKTFTLANPTNSMVTVEIEQDTSETQYFNVEPKKRKLLVLIYLNFTVVSLKPGQRKEVKVYFTPQEAKVIISSCIFNFKEGENTHTRVLKVSGIGKFPFINLNEEKLNFEQMTVGKTASKIIQLRNHGQVTSHFEIEKISDDGKDQSFSLSSYSGVIKAGSS